MNVFEIKKDRLLDYLWDNNLRNASKHEKKS